MRKRPRLCYVVSSEMTVLAFLKSHIIHANFVGYDVSVVLNTSNINFLSGSGLPGSLRRLPFFGNKMKIEASVLLGDRDEGVEVHGEPDCWDSVRGRCGVAGGRDLQEAWHQ